MAEPVIAQKSPFGTQEEEGKSYWWCACGLSEEQPFCDGSHKGTGLEPSKYNTEKAGSVYFRGCKKPRTLHSATARIPSCEGVA